LRTFGVNRALRGRTQRGPHLCHKNIGTTMNVRGCESQEPESSIDQQVLSSIVLDQALPMIAPVVLENEPRRGVVEVGPTDEPVLAVMKIGLDLRAREAGLYQKPPQPSLHRRFGTGRNLGQRA